MGTIVRAEIWQPSRGKRKVRCTFAFDQETVQKVKRIPGAEFRGHGKEGGPCWTFPLDFDTMRLLRQQVGKFLIFSSELQEWGRGTRDKRQNLLSMSLGVTADLIRLPDANPDLYRAVYAGPRGRGQDAKWFKQRMTEPGSYQTADVAFMATCDNPMNTNQPGTGKTIETIAALFECDMVHGPKLVSAPKTSIETVWGEELQKWGGGQPVLLCYGSREQKMDVLYDAELLLSQGRDFWLVTNPQTLQMQTQRITDEDGFWLRDEDVSKFPFIHMTPWTVCILDEFHKSGVTNSDTVTFKGLMEIKAEKKIALSGTPIGGKPIKFWGILHWLEPEQFTSKWQWAERWLEIRDDRGGRQAGDVRKEMQNAFNEHIGQYVLRRTKAEVLPDLPPKQYVELIATMEEGSKQEKQYLAMAEEAEWRMAEEEGEGSISATSILAEYTRLKQFAGAFCTLGKYINKEMTKREVIPTEDSCKLPYVMQILEERGILDNEGDEQVVIFSQFSSFVDMIHNYLVNNGVNAVKLTGATAQKRRTEIQREFQGQDADRPRVIVMTTTAGGVSINLDNASTVILWDETWNPDDQEQAEDRVHRASRIHQVTIYRIITKRTIEDYIRKVNVDKGKINQRILDIRRSGFRATTGVAA